MKIYLCPAFGIFLYDKILYSPSALNGLGLPRFRSNSKDKNRKTSLGLNKRGTSPLQSLHVHGETQSITRQTRFYGSSGNLTCSCSYAPQTTRSGQVLTCRKL
jgi:hypothetical protein